MKNFINRVIRFALRFRRPSKRRNMRLLRQRGESLSSIKIREACKEDIPALAVLHVQTWNETYPEVKNPPARTTREAQWRQQFKIKDGSWFCYVVENGKGELVGFAKGNIYSSDELPAYGGELNKIYIRRHYQRLGIGRKLMNEVAKRFLRQNISSMVLFGIPQNPSAYFHEAMGGQKLYSRKGEFHGGYGWTDLRHLVDMNK